MPNLSKFVKYTSLSIFVFSTFLLTASLKPPKAQSIADINQGVEESELAVINEAKDLNSDAFFSIVIPKLGAAAKIIPNIDPLNQASYEEALKQGVAHASPSFYPGQGNTIFLFAHSTNNPLNIGKYNAVFYSLKDLKKGDQIVLFYKYKKYFYEVEKVEITDKEDLVSLLPQHHEVLILQTCYPPGTNQKRLLVTALPINN